MFSVSNDRNRWERSFNPNPPNRWINATNQQNRSTTQNSSPTITGSKRPRSEITCFNCAEKGHYQREFPIRMRSQEIEATLKRQRTTDDRFIAPSKQPPPTTTSCRMVDSTPPTVQTTQSQPPNTIQQPSGTSTSILIVDDNDEQTIDVMTIDQMSTTHRSATGNHYDSECRSTTNQSKPSFRHWEW